jgi:hypothetical protein
MRKIRNLLSDKSGGSMLTPLWAVMMGTLILAVLFQFIYLYSMVLGIIDYTQNAVLQTATSNSYNAFHGVREGNSSAHYYAGAGVWQEIVSSAEMSRRLQDMLQLEKKGNGLYKYYDDGKLKYAISDIQVHCTNVSVGTHSADIKLTFTTKATAEVPIYFLGVTQHVKIPVSL